MSLGSLMRLGVGGAGFCYYVDATGGSDLNNGRSASAAWQTLGKVNAQAFAPGDQVLFKRGEAWTGGLNLPSSGIAAAPIVFATYGTGARPTITNNISNPLNTMNRDWVRVEGIHTVGAINNGEAAIKVWGTNIVLLDCEFEGGENACCYIWGDRPATSNITVSNCIIHGCTPANGIVTQNNVGDSVGGLLIEYCLIHDNGQDAGLDHGVYLARCDDAIVRGNAIYSNFAHGIIMTQVTNAVIERNNIYGNGGSGIQMLNLAAGCNVTVRNNLLHSNSASGLNVQASVDDVGIYFNTVVNNDAYGIFVNNGASGNVIKNNISLQDDNVVGGWNHPGVVTGAGALDDNDWDRNCYDYLNHVSGKSFNVGGGEKTFAEWKAYPGSPDLNSLEDDPDFVTDYTDLHLQLSSPARGAGEDVGITDDYDGVVRGSPPDIGAYEYVAP